jgi:hypothetical protein
MYVHTCLQLLRLKTRLAETQMQVMAAAAATTGSSGWGIPTVTNSAMEDNLMMFTSEDYSMNLAAGAGGYMLGAF